MMRSILLAFCFLGSLLTQLPARADLMVPLPVEEIATRSQLVLQGKVLTNTVLRDDEGQIYTKVELQVDEVWKGALATNRFIIVLGGGILGDEGMTISGQVDYEVGEEVVAFLVLNARGEGVTLGLSQGKFHVWSDPVTGEKLVRNRFHGMRPAAPESAAPSPRALAVKIHPPPVVIHRLTLADLKQRCAGGAK